MNQRGKPKPGPELYNPYGQQPSNGPQSPSGPVFPGKPGLQNTHGKHNLAVQRSLMEIFDDFTEVISGELKSMTFEDIDGQKPQ